MLGQARQRQILEPQTLGHQQAESVEAADLMRRSIVMLALFVTALWSGPVFAQSRAQPGPLCTSEGTPVDKQIDARSKIAQPSCPLALGMFKAC